MNAVVADDRWQANDMKPGLLKKLNRLRGNPSTCERRALTHDAGISRAAWRDRARFIGGEIFRQTLRPGAMLTV